MDYLTVTHSRIRDSISSVQGSMVIFGERVMSQSWLVSLKERVGFAPEKRPENRTVYVNNVQTSLIELPEVVVPETFMDNIVISSKYTMLTFLPKNLFEQFKRVANFYFLCVSVIMLALYDMTPVSPFTSLMPLAFVITITAFKQGYEDWRRHKADKEVNLKSAHVIRDGQLVDVMSKEIQVGDIVKVMVDHSFPCDMVLFSSSEADGSCYVTTANLDGETNLKIFTSIQETREYQTVERLSSAKAVIQCEQPITDLYHFIGRIFIHGQLFPLGPENVLLRGCRLRDTSYVYGCAIYTGQETKMALNSKFKSGKFSRVEKSMNSYLLVCLLFLLLECSLCVVLKYAFINLPTPPVTNKEKTTARKVLINFLSFLVLYNYIIPISLYVTIEIQKFIGSLFFKWDLEMYDSIADIPAKANTSDLNEELGQVQYLFSDKTGTLTENDMQFRHCFINGKSYTDSMGMLCHQIHIDDLHPTPVVQFTREINEFMMVLTLCHSCHIEKKAPDIDDLGASCIYSMSGMDYRYQASSPDEKAFLEACRRFGVVYHGVTENKMEVSYHKTMHRYEMLHTLEFDPTRKRMSVIIRTDAGKIYLLCKGAESALFDRIDDKLKQKTYEKINYYAKLGLRTLVLAHRQLTQDELTKFDFLLMQSRTSMAHREEMLRQAFDRIEQNLTLLGATAVEDRLQEDVPEVIEALTAAGIKVWVLTGDKEETAVNISYSAGHFMPGAVELRLTKMKSSEECGKLVTTLIEQLDKNREIDISYVLVVDGLTLNYMLNDFREMFRVLGAHCAAVLCCRLSPVQKAEVVRLIKLSDSSPVTAAIGDGANDVSMIQEAHVGLGIVGKEGRQAARCSDYSFSKFKFVKRALLLHGHYFYYRLAMMVQYFFYKNVAFITAQLYYIFFSAYSQQTLYSSFLLTIYNLTCTSLPIFIYGLFEQHISQSTLLEKPGLYKNITNNELLKWKHFLRWTLIGFWHSFVFFFGAYFLLLPDASLFYDGMMIDNFSFGALIYTIVVFSVNAKLVFETFYWCVPVVASYVITIAGFFLLVFFQSSIIWPIFFKNQMYGVFTKLLSSITVWLALLLLMTVALIPDLIIKVLLNRQMMQITEKTKEESTSLSTLDASVTGLSFTEISEKLPITERDMINVIRKRGGFANPPTIQFNNGEIYEDAFDNEGFDGELVETPRIC